MFVNVPVASVQRPDLHVALTAPQVEEPFLLSS